MPSDAALSRPADCHIASMTIEVMMTVEKDSIISMMSSGTVGAITGGNNLPILPISTSPTDVNISQRKYF